MLKEVDNAIRGTQNFIRLTYAFQALTCGVGAFCAGIAIESFLHSSPIVGLLNLVAAYFSAVQFNSQAESRAMWRQILSEWRDKKAELERNGGWRLGE